MTDSHNGSNNKQKVKPRYCQYPMKTFGENLSFIFVDIERKRINDRQTDGRKNERNDRQPKSYIKRGYNKCDQYTRTGF